MSIRKAVLSDLSMVRQISEVTISEIYPRYYPKGAVDFFLKHHSEDHISRDLERDLVYLCLDESREIVGTITIKENEITPLRFHHFPRGVVGCY